MHEKIVLGTCREQWDNKKEKRNMALGHRSWNNSTVATFLEWSLDPKALPWLSQKQGEPALEQRNYCTRNNIKTLLFPLCTKKPSIVSSLLFVASNTFVEILCWPEAAFQEDCVTKVRKHSSVMIHQSICTAFNLSCRWIFLIALSWPRSDKAEQCLAIKWQRLWE